VLLRQATLGFSIIGTNCLLELGMIDVLLHSPATMLMKASFVAFSIRSSHATSIQKIILLILKRFIVEYRPTVEPN